LHLTCITAVVTSLPWSASFLEPLGRSLQLVR